MNKLRGTFACCAVKAPGFGDRRKAMLEDIAVLTGGHVVAAELGIKLENVALADLGHAQRVVIDKDDTTIIGGGGDKAQIEGRCKELRRQIEDTTSDYDREKLEERLAKLSGGVAVIRVGAPSEAEMKNRHDAFDDAIHATKAAVAEGIVPGGGVALVRCIDAVEKEEAKCEGDERTGVPHPAPGARGAGAPDRRELGRRRRRGGRAACAPARARFGFDAARSCYVDLDRGRHHRPHQGRARRAGERGVGRRRAAAHRGDADRDRGAAPSSRPLRAWSHRRTAMTTRVKEWMSTDPVTIEPQAPAREALALMVEHGDPTPAGGGLAGPRGRRDLDRRPARRAAVGDGVRRESRRARVAPSSAPGASAS